MPTTRSAAPDLVDYLPPCVADVADLADELHRKAIRPFPDTSQRPKSGKAARRVLDDCVSWARAVSLVLSGSASHRSRPSLAAAFDMSNSAARLEHALDIFGTPPRFVTDRSACWALICFERGGSNDPERGGKKLPTNWAAVSHEVRAAYLVAYTQAMQAVAWVRQQIKSMTDAAVPLLHVDGNAKTVSVSSAGATTCRPITTSHMLALRDLCERGTHSTKSRNTITGRGSRTLLGRIPELAPFVQQVPGSRAGPSSNAATFRIDTIARARISFEQAHGS